MNRLTKSDDESPPSRALRAGDRLRIVSLATPLVLIALMAACALTREPRRTRQRADFEGRKAFLRRLGERCVADRSSKTVVEGAFRGEARPARSWRPEDGKRFVLEDVREIRVDAFPPVDYRCRVLFDLDPDGRVRRCVVESDGTTL